MSYMDINLTGETFTDYQLSDVGASAFELEHDWFTKQDLVIRTASGGGGTLLVEGTDYTLSVESEDLSDRVTAAVGSGRNVYHNIAIINATYQSGDLYFSGKYIADSNSAADVEYRRVAEISGEDYTIRDADQIGTLEVDPDGADRTVTLPTVADSEHRQLTIVNAAGVSTSYKVIVEGEGAELINEVTTWWLFPGQSVTLKSNGTIWRKVAGHEPILHVQDQKASGNAGGTATSGSWQLRTLNTEVKNEIAGASLGSNQITLPPGLYEVEASAPAYACYAHQAKLMVSGGSDILLGTSESTHNTSPKVTRSLVNGVFALAAETVIELRHRVNTTISTAGFGADVGWGTNIYSDVKIRKLV